MNPARFRNLWCVRHWSESQMKTVSMADASVPSKKWILFCQICLSSEICENVVVMLSFGLCRGWAWKRKASPWRVPKFGKIAFVQENDRLQESPFVSGPQLSKHRSTRRGFKTICATHEIGVRLWNHCIWNFQLQFEFHEALLVAAQRRAER